MISTTNQVVSSREIHSIEKLDELSLYLEISKYKTTLVSLKQESITNVVNELAMQQLINETKERLTIYLSSLTRFGIDPTNQEEVNSWMHACKNFLNSLDVIEYATFLNHRATCQSLELFGKQEYGRSSYYTKENKNT